LIAEHYKKNFGWGRRCRIYVGNMKCGKFYSEMLNNLHESGADKRTVEGVQLTTEPTPMAS